MALSISISSPLQTLVPSATIALLVILAMTSKAYSQGESTFFDYNFEVAIPNSITFQGDASVPSDVSLIRLTKTNASGSPLPQSAGRILHSAPVLFREPGAEATIETSVTFSVRSKPGDTQPGDGLVFFIAPVNTTIPAGATGGNLGVYNQSGDAPNILAIEFDYYVNCLWDPYYPHIGINLGSRNSSNVTSFEAIDGQRVTATIVYEEGTKVIRVSASSGSAIFKLRYVHDLGSLLDESVQVGIAASSGEHVAVHDVYSWSFASAIVRTNIRQVV